MSSGGPYPRAVGAIRASRVGRDCGSKAPGAIGRGPGAGGAPLDMIAQSRGCPARAHSLKRRSVTPNRHFNHWRHSTPRLHLGSRAAPFDERCDGT